MDIPTNVPHEPVAPTQAETGVVDVPNPTDASVDTAHVEQSGSFQPEQQSSTEVATHSAPADEQVAEQTVNAVPAPEPEQPVQAEPKPEAHTPEKVHQPSGDLSKILGHVDAYKAAQDAIDEQGIVNFEQELINARIEGGVQNA